jgi:uncharacterized protein
MSNLESVIYEIKDRLKIAPDIYLRIASYVKDTLGLDTAGHGWLHIERVSKLAVRIALDEGGDLDVLLQATLLHDIAILREIYEGVDHAEEGAKISRSILEDLGIPDDMIEKVVYAVRVHRFGANITPHTIEARILQDADRLDALGAVGIARAFSYGGFRRLPMYLPGEKPDVYDPFKLKSTLTHFYEKILKLKDCMNTETARKIAEDRHRFILAFLDRFLDEIEGIC